MIGLTHSPSASESHPIIRPPAGSESTSSVPVRKRPWLLVGIAVSAAVLAGAVLTLTSWSAEPLLDFWQQFVTSASALALLLIAVLALVVLLRRRIEEAEATSVRLTRYIESALDGIVITDGDGRIHMVNAQTEYTFGYHRDELIGQHVERVLPGDSWHQQLNAVASKRSTLDGRDRKSVV